MDIIVTAIGMQTDTGTNISIHGSTFTVIDHDIMIHSWHITLVRHADTEVSTFMFG